MIINFSAVPAVPAVSKFPNFLNFLSEFKDFREFSVSHLSPFPFPFKQNGPETKISGPFYLSRLILYFSIKTWNISGE